MIEFLSKADPGRLRGTALLRLDFNTEDNWRMEAAVPTIRFLLRTASKTVIISHRGRPDPGLIGSDKKIGAANAKLSLEKDAANLENLLKRKVMFLTFRPLGEAKKAIAAAPDGSVIVLENIRFFAGEEKNDPKFARELALLGDFYVNDAFAVSHRANASVSAVTKFLPSYAGLEMENEIKFLGRAIAKPKQPLVFILGGAKAGDKLGVITYFKKKADWFLLGGGPANTMLALRGMDVKKSIRDTDPKSLAALEQFALFGKIVLPQDFVWHKSAIVDFGPKTVRAFSQKVAAARMIAWSGPLGMIEVARYAKGTLALARAIAKNRRAFSVAGGGETVMFLKKHKLDKKFSFISTGGGAMVDFLAGKKLPGIVALEGRALSRERREALKR